MLQHTHNLDVILFTRLLTYIDLINLCNFNF